MKKDITDYNFFKDLTKLSYLKKIVLFGSWARGEQTKTSDFDIAIKTIGQTNRHQIYEIIEKADTLRKIDVVWLDELQNDSFKQRIQKEGKVIYEKSAN